MTDRIACPALLSRITNTDTAALIRPSETVAGRTFNGSGFITMVPQVPASHILRSPTE